MHRCMVLILVSLGCLALMPGTALAGVGAGAVPTFPSQVTAGQTTVSASITMSNANTPPNESATNTVCNFGDVLPCPAGDPGITLIPSCGALGAFSTCAASGKDPGVFQVSATGIGAAGTACAGMVFDITMIDPAYGQVRFTPSLVGAHVTLPGVGSVCRINFTFSVLKVPTIDQDPATPGIQTVQVTDNTQTLGSISVSARGTSSGTTVQAAPTIATRASGNINLGGGQVTDTATVSGRVNPVAGATVAFNLYAPGDATCSGTPIFTSTVAIDLGGTATSGGFTPTAAGTYRWRASYSGDANNAPVAGACNDANESVVVNPTNPTIATVASANVGIGGQISDVATVSGRVNPVAGATVAFNLYPPGDPACAGPAVFTSTVAINPDGTATSAAFTPTAAGTYRWIASYSGDVNNNKVSGACNDANETVTVNPANPTISTSASGSAEVGGPVTDTAIVTGRVNPIAGATVTFLLFGPNDVACSGGAVFTSTVMITDGGTATSAPFIPATAGTYRWTASYSGDANNASVSAACNDADEAVFVSLPEPTVTLPATGSASGAPTLMAPLLIVVGTSMLLLVRRRQRDTSTN